MADLPFRRLGDVVAEYQGQEVQAVAQRAQTAIAGYAQAVLLMMAQLAAERWRWDRELREEFEVLGEDFIDEVDYPRVLHGVNEALLRKLALTCRDLQMWGQADRTEAHRLCYCRLLNQHSIGCDFCLGEMCLWCGQPPEASSGSFVNNLCPTCFESDHTPDALKFCWPLDVPFD